MIYKIARTELRTLFYSPIAWLLLLCFVIQTGMHMTKVYEMFILGIVYNASSDIFVDQGLWYQVADFLYFYIPLLTMGVISRQFNSGSIKLLYSSPVSNTQIVLGKFLAMVMFGALLMGILLGYVIFAEFTVRDFELSWILTGLFGLFLLTCTYMAVGIFVSSLTSYQIIAAVGTFVVLMLLGMVGGWGQHYDFVREITYWLGINGRTHTFIQGMICSEDLIYFPVITAMFLALTVIRLNAVRQKQRFMITLRKNLLVIVLVCVVAFLSSRPVLTGYVDTTSTKQNTLTPVSQEIIKQLKGGMTITSYVNILDPNYLQFSYPKFIMQNRDEFRRYTRFKPEIKLNVVYYWADTPNDGLEKEYPGLTPWEKTRKLCERYDVDSTMLKNKEEIDRMVDLSEEGYVFVRQIVRKNGQKEWLRYFRDRGSLPSEAEVSVSLKRMVMELPKFGYLTGHRERSLYGEDPQGYGFVLTRKEHQRALINQGFDVVEVTLDQPVPDDINVLMIADMRSDLTPEEDGHFREYLERGDHVFILGEPRHREAQNPMLNRHFGVELTPLLAGPDIRFKGHLLANQLACLSTPSIRERMYQMGAGVLLMEGCSGIEQLEDKGFSLHPFFITDTIGQFWTELETTDFLDDTVRFNPSVGEVSKIFNTMIGLTRQCGEKEQRIIISGDADCLTSNEFMLSRGVSGQNQALILGTGHWLSEGKAPLDVRRSRPTDWVVYLGVDGFRILKWTLLGGVPLLILFLGAFVWIRRRGR